MEDCGAATLFYLGVLAALGKKVYFRTPLSDAIVEVVIVIGTERARLASSWLGRG